MVYLEVFATVKERALSVIRPLVAIDIGIRLDDHFVFCTNSWKVQSTKVQKVQIIFRIRCTLRAFSMVEGGTFESDPSRGQMNVPFLLNEK